MQPDSTRGKNNETFNPVNVPKYATLFNFATLERKNDTGTADARLYTNNLLQFSDLNAVELVNSLAQDKSLNAHIEMGCSFGFIEFQASGTYDSHISDSSTYVNYSICKQAPVLNSNLQVANIAALANKGVMDYIDSKPFEQKLDSLWDLYDKATEGRDKDRKRRKIEEISEFLYEGFSKSFAKSYWNIYNIVKNLKTLYIDSGEYDKKLKTELAALDSKYGPYFISGGQFGGSFNMYAKIDKKNITDTTNFQAEITANISDKFSLDSKAVFNSTGKQYCKNSVKRIIVYGGNATETGSAIEDFLDSDMTNGAKFKQILSDWAKSFAKTEKNPDGTVEPTNAAPISFTITPIWSLFDDSEVKGVVEDYFMNKYKEKGIENWTNFVSGGESLGDVESMLKKLSERNVKTNSDNSKK